MGAAGPTPWRVAFQMGQWRSALPALQAALEREPDDADTHARIGYVQAKIGRFGDAIASFQMALGSEWYEEKALRPHADSLRATGALEEAIALRRQVVLQADAARERVAAGVELALDLRAAEDPAAAEAALYAVLSESPREEDAFALLAELALDRGDLEEAGYQLWMADRYGADRPWTRVAHAHLAIAEGDLDGALLYVNHGKKKGRDLSPWALQAEILRRMGDPEGGLALLDSGFLGDQDRPELLSARIACLASAGQRDEASELARRAVSLYPRDAGVRAALAVLAED
jgi:tetratricopeptide (TPR) repeat protein